MRLSGSTIGIIIILLTWVAASLADTPKLADNIVTTDDCFTAFSGDAKKCELGYCLGRVAVGDEDGVAALKYNACQQGTGDRVVASINEQVDEDKLPEGDELPAPIPENNPFK